MPTPNMTLTLPVVSVTPGPTYATEINAAFDAVDEHDHTTGKGARVPTAGLDINADLSFDDNDATDVRTVAFSSQGSPLSLSDVNAVYVSDGDLYFNDGSGTSIQLTADGTLNAASIGGIGGDYTTSTAALFYTAASKVFTFEQSTNTAAKLDCGDITIHLTTSPSQPGITLASPSIVGAYTLTLPTALPGSTLPLQVSSAGVMTTGQITTAQIGDTQVTGAKLAANLIPVKVWANFLMDGAGNVSVESGSSGITGTPTITGTGNSVLRFQFTTPFAARCILIATVSGGDTAGSPNGRIAQTVNTGDGWTTHGQVNVRDDTGTNINLATSVVRVSVIALGNT